MDESLFAGPSVQVRLLDESRGSRCSATGFIRFAAPLHPEGVVRRYSDFRRLHESLVQRRPHWLIPELPTRGRPELPTLPGASGLAMRQRRQRRLFLEEREAGLQDYLTALRRHPVLGQDAELEHFLMHCNGNEARVDAPIF
ncbi:hypothetical protein BOX15_Mlig008124g6 [Macrostomum lignano]|uniref:PX domain-containing protein n=1 Tax=Macrostomum lignano TaxID=282301 RepID=A0A267GAQ1_9PLAT|nr:hypothetical protein BOX15_Mlig008124g6 [Macrostomum lignano]